MILRVPFLLLLAVAVLSCGREGEPPNTDPDGAATDTADSETAVDSGEDTFLESKPEAIDQLPGWRMEWLVHSLRPEGVGGYVHLNNLLLSPTGKVMVGGFYLGRTRWSAGSPDELDMIGNGDNGFVLQYDANGQLEWARHIGANNSSSPTTQIFGMAADPANGVIVGGSFFCSETTFNAGLPDETSMICDDETAEMAFIVAYRGDGSLRWVHPYPIAPSSSADYGWVSFWSLAPLENDRVVAAGRFVGTLNYADSQDVEQQLGSSNGGTFDGVWTLMDENHQIYRAQGIGSPGYDSFNEVCGSPDGGFYVMGRFHGELTLGAGESNETTIVSQGNWGAYLAKYDGNGNLVWVHLADYRAAYSKGGSFFVARNGDILFFETIYDATLPVGDAGAQIDISIDGHIFGLVYMTRLSSDGKKLWTRVHRTIGLWTDCAELTDGELGCVGYYYKEILFNYMTPQEHGVNSPSLVQESGIMALFDENGILRETMTVPGPGGVIFWRIVTKGADEAGPEAVFVAGDFAGEVAFGSGPPDQQTVDVGLGDAYNWFNSQMFLFALVREEQE